MRLKCDYFLTANILLSYYIQTWHDCWRMDAIYAHAPFDDRDLDARSQWVGNGKNLCCMLSATKQTISIKLATTADYFYVTLTLQTFMRLNHLVSFVPALTFKYLVHPLFLLLFCFLPSFVLPFYYNKQQN